MHRDMRRLWIGDARLWIGQAERRCTPPAPALINESQQLLLKGLTLRGGQIIILFAAGTKTPGKQTTRSSKEPTVVCRSHLLSFHRSSKIRQIVS